MADLRKEDWLQLLRAIDPPVFESVSSVIGQHKPEDEITYSEMISYANVINQSIRDAETYRMIPSELRQFLESDSEAMYTLARRLTQAVNARDQVTVIRDYLDMAKGTDEKCAKCELMEIVKAIEVVLNSSFLDLSA